jgi:hypothetical protein
LKQRFYGVTPFRGELPVRPAVKRVSRGKRQRVATIAPAARQSPIGGVSAICESTL